MNRKLKSLNKRIVIECTPDPAVREMLLHMKQAGIETPFDRF
jgi:anaerobic carbon-monoxide dehydrogenase catalytic subunit